MGLTQKDLPGIEISFQNDHLVMKIYSISPDTLKNSTTVTRLTNMTKEDENSIQLIPAHILQGFSILWLIGAVIHAYIGIN